MLTPEAKHFIAICDLGRLEQLARQADDEIDISSRYEDNFTALDKRTKLPPAALLDWGALSGLGQKFL